MKFEHTTANLQVGSLGGEWPSARFDPVLVVQQHSTAGGSHPCLQHRPVVMFHERAENNNATAAYSFDMLPALLLRLEGAALFFGALSFYRSLRLSWILFIALFLWPDTFMVGYLL